MPPVRRAPLGTYVAALAALSIATQLSVAQAGQTDSGRHDESVIPEATPQADSEKATLSLDQIEPPVEKPAIASVDADMPDRARRAVEQAAQLRADDRFTEATLELEKALRVAPDSPIVNRELALTYWDADDADRAREYADAALAAAQDDVACHYLLGRLAARRFENAEAIRQLRIALLCTTDEANKAYRKLAEYHLAEALRAEGYLTASIELYERFLADLGEHPSGSANRELAALQRAGEAPILEHIAAAYASLGDWDRAAERMSAASDAADMDAAARVRFADVLAHAGRLEEAADQARMAIPGDPEAMRLLAHIRTEQGKPGAYVDDLRAAIADKPQNVAMILELAGALTRLDRSAEAIALLRENIAQDPDNTELTWALFDALIAQQDWSGAFAVAVDAVRRDPANSTDAEARIAPLAKSDAAWDAINRDEQRDSDCTTAYMLGVVAAARGEEDAACERFDKAIALKPTFLPARLACGELLARRFAWKDVIEVVAPDGIVPSPDSRVAYLLARAYLGLDELDSAQEQLQTAIRLNDKNTDAMFELAKLYVATNQPTRATRQLEALVRADPINEQGREMLFEAYLADGDHRAAAEQLAELRRLAASPTCIARCVARIEYNPTQPQSEQRYRDTLDEAMREYKPDEQTLILIADSYERENRYDEAVKTLERAVELGPVDSRPIEQLVRCYRLNLQFEEALDGLQKLAQRYPNRIAVKAAIIDTLLVVQRFDDAIAATKKMLDEAGEDDENGMAGALRSTLIQTELLKGDYDAAIDMLEQWRKEDPTNVTLLRWLVATLQDADRNDDALALLRKWRDEVPSGFAVAGMSGIWANVPQSQQDEVIQLMLENVLDDPDNDMLQTNLIDLLRITKRYDEAIALAENNIATGNDPAVYRAEMYQAYDAAGRFDDAIELLNVMLAENASPQFGTPFTPIQLQIELAQLLVKSGRYAKALEKLNRWLEDAATKDERLVYLGALAYAHQEAGDLIEAVEALSLAFELDPTDVGVHNDLGYTLADEGRDLDRAEELIRYAVANDPRNSAYLDSLGWVLYKKGDFAGAVEWLTRSRRAGDGEDPVVCHHLGDACWRAGEREQAVQWWTEAAKFAAKRMEQTAWPRDLDKKTLEKVQANIAAAEAGEQPELAPTGQSDK